MRMLLSALSYVLIDRLRALALQGTALAKEQVDTLCIKLLKVSCRRDPQHVPDWPVPGFELAQRAYLCARHEPDKWQRV